MIVGASASQSYTVTIDPVADLVYTGDYIGHGNFKVEIDGATHEGLVDEIPLLRGSWYGIEDQVPA